MGICTDDRQVGVANMLGEVYKVTLNGVLDREGGRVDLTNFHYRIVCRDQPTQSQSKTMTDAVNSSCQGPTVFYARDGFRLDISVRRKIKNEKGKQDEIKYWFLITRLATNLSTADGQVEFDPNFFDLEKSGRNAKKVKKDLPKNYDGVGSKLLLKIELIEFPSEIFGPKNGLMGRLPVKRRLQLRELFVDFVGTKSDSEKRLKIGEHNGVAWVLPPSLILLHADSGDKSEDLKTILLTGNESVTISAYSQLRVELEEIMWEPTSQKTGAQRTSIFAGFIDIRSKKKLGSRAVFLHGRDGNRANFKFIIDDEKSRAAVRKSDDVLKSSKVVHYNSDLMKLLNPTVEQAVITRQAAPKSYLTTEALVAVDIEVLGAIASRPPARVKFQAISSHVEEYDCRIGACKEKNLHSLSPAPKMQLNLDQHLLSRTVILRIVDAYSSWVLGTVPVSLKALKRNEVITCDVKAVKNDEFYSFHQIDGLRLRLKLVPNTFNVFQFATLSTGSLNYTLPITSMSSIRTWANTDPRLLGKVEKLQQKQVFKNTDATLAEKIRLSRKERLQSFDDRELAITKASVIHSTLVNAATEYITVIGQAGLTSCHVLRLTNPTPSDTIVYVNKLSNRFTFRPRPFLSLSSNGQNCFSLGGMSDVEIELDFFPVMPQVDFDYVIDFVTSEGNIFHRFCLKGYVTCPNSYSSVRIVESERTKIKKTIHLPVPLTDQTHVTSAITVANSGSHISYSLREVASNVLELACSTPRAPDRLTGWIHVTMYGGRGQIHSIYLEIDSAISIYSQVEEGSIGWLLIPNSFFNLSNCLLHYSHPADLSAEYPPGGVSIETKVAPGEEENHNVEFALYGFAPGSYRRRLRVTAGGRVMQDYLLLLQINPAKISKSFDVYLSGARAVKKVEINNPYPTEKVFRIHGSKQPGLRIRQPAVTLPPVSASKIDVELSGAIGKFLVFINDEDNQPEDAFAIHVR